MITGLLAVANNTCPSWISTLLIHRCLNRFEHLDGALGTIYSK